MKKIITFFVFALFLVITVQATTHIVMVQDFKFNPANITVQVGDTVKWVWDINGSPHTTTSTSVPPTAATWDKPISSTSPTYSYKVTVAGNYSYFCTIHTSMVGTITATPATGVTNYTNKSFLKINSITSSNLNVEYNLVNPTSVEIELLDVEGRLIRNLLSVHKTNGAYNEKWSLNDLQKGVYLIVMKTNEGIDTHRIVLQ